MRLFTSSLLMLSFGLLSASAQKNNADPANPNGRGNGLCNTPECKATADAILENMDANADPCQDFYNFACGGFLQQKEIPPDRADISTIDFDRSINITKQILESDPKMLKGIDGKELDEASLRNFNKIQSVYNLCMNETQLVSVGVKPLYDELQQLVTSIFPVQDSSLTQLFANGTTTMPPSPSSIDRETLTSAMAHFTKAGIPSLFSLSTMIDPINDPSIQRIAVQESGLTLPVNELYQAPNILGMFQEIVQTSFTLTLGNNNNNNIDTVKLAQDVVAFETQLASISSSAVEKSVISKIFNPRTVQQLDQLSPAFDWAMLLEKTLGNTSQNNKNITVIAPGFVERVGKLVSTTSPATLQTYFAWKVIHTQSVRLSAEYRAPLEKLNAVLTGRDLTKPPPRWRTCASTVSSNLGPLVGYFYVGREFIEDDRKAMVDIIEALKESYQASLPKLDWLDNQTLANALRKIKAMEPLVGYSTVAPNIGSPTDLEQYYADLEIKDGDFYGSVGQSLQIMIAKNLNLAGKKTQRKHMFSDPQTINAFYYPMTNQIIFPAAFVQPPMYRTGVPEYINYGGIGYVAAHEITHGFDTSGRMFDYDGRLHNWWTNETDANFNTKAQCVIDQYSKFTISNPLTNGTSVNVNGLLTVGENIADNGGIKQAFSTWLSRYNADRDGKRYNNQVLPGLEKWTRDQMFFLVFGQVWCAKFTPEIELQLLNMDPHAPNRWRVNGPLQNLPAFAQAFKCSPGSPMNPANRCSVW